MICGERIIPVPRIDLLVVESNDEESSVRIAESPDGACQTVGIGRLGTAEVVVFTLGVQRAGAGPGCGSVKMNAMRRLRSGIPHCSEPDPK